MNIIKALLFVTLFYASLAFSGSKITSQQHKEFSDLYTQGMIGANSSQFIDSFSDEVMILPEYDKAYLGLNNAKEYFNSIFKSYEIAHHKRKLIEIIPLGDRSVAIGTFEISFSEKNSNNSVSLPGTFFEVWDTSAKTPKLLTLAWNYDKHIEGIENSFRGKTRLGVHYFMQPVAPIKDFISLEVAAMHSFTSTLMLRKQPEALALKYAEDAWYAPHNKEMVMGSSAIKDFLVDYSSNWPAFDYIDVNSHTIYSHNEFVLEHISYNLRWRTSDNSGIGKGKGIRISKRNKKGQLEVYRSIAMHD